MNTTEYKEIIKAEYIKSMVHYEAMRALVKAADIDINSAEKTQETAKETQTEQQKPTSTVKPQEEQAKPKNTKPEMVLNGSTEYNVSVGDKIKFSVDFNNISSTSDYRIIPNGSPNFIAYEISAIKTATGYKVKFEVKAIRTGQGSFKAYIKSDPDNYITVVINIK